MPDVRGQDGSGWGPPVLSASPSFGAGVTLKTKTGLVRIFTAIFSSKNSRKQQRAETGLGLGIGLGLGQQADEAAKWARAACAPADPACAQQPLSLEQALLVQHVSELMLDEASCMYSRLKKRSSLMSIAKSASSTTQVRMQARGDQVC